MADFERPIRNMTEQTRFSPTEVGLTHPFTNAFIRLNDDGDIELIAGPGLAIIFHPQNRSITFVADSVKFFTKEQDGFRWNKLSLNPQGSNFIEPAFLQSEDQSMNDMFAHTDDFFEDDDNEADGD